MVEVERPRAADVLAAIRSASPAQGCPRGLRRQRRQRSFDDFTAVGDVVNVAAPPGPGPKGGEIVASGRLVEQLAEPVGEGIEVDLKGKAEPVVAYPSAAAA